MVLDFSKENITKELLQRVERLEVELEELRNFYNNHIKRLHEIIENTGREDGK